MATAYNGEHITCNNLKKKCEDEIYIHCRPICICCT